MDCKLIIGAPVERAELFYAEPDGDWCDNGHEAENPRHKWCPYCSLPLRPRLRERPTELCRKICDHAKARVEPASWEAMDLSYWVHVFRLGDGRVLDKGVVGQPVYVENALDSYYASVPYFKPQELPAQVDAVRADLEKLGLAARGVGVYVVRP